MAEWLRRRFESHQLRRVDRVNLMHFYIVTITLTLLYYYYCYGNIVTIGLQTQCKMTIVLAVICSDSDRVAYNLRPASSTIRCEKRVLQVKLNPTEIEWFIGNWLLVIGYLPIFNSIY